MNTTSRQNAGQDKTKSQYSPPKLREVQLTAREVLGVGCKTATASGPVPGPQCVQGQCFARDSS